MIAPGTPPRSKGIGVFDGKANAFNMRGSLCVFGFPKRRRQPYPVEKPRKACFLGPKRVDRGRSAAGYENLSPLLEGASPLTRVFVTKSKGAKADRYGFPQAPVNAHESPSSHLRRQSQGPL
jgi:hypothetical protein